MKTLVEYLELATVAHGHLCAGQVLGVRLAMLGLRELGIDDPIAERKRIGNAAIDLNVGNEAFALGDGIVDAAFAQSEHRQAHAEHLSRTKMTMRPGREFQIFAERFHLNLRLFSLSFLNTLKRS